MSWLRRAVRLATFGVIGAAMGEARDSGALPRGPLENLGKSFVDNVIKDKVTPKPGSIVHCDLGLGTAEHTGVYVGSNRIVELNGDGRIREVSPDTFINSSAFRTAISIYVACNEQGEVLYDPVIADRAREFCGGQRSYNLLFDNCHQFTASCITGEPENPNNFFSFLTDLIGSELNGGRPIDWRVWDR